VARSIRPALALAASAALVGGALLTARFVLPDAAPVLDPRVEAVFPLALGTRFALDLARVDDPRPVPLEFRVTAWERVAGAPHARLEGVVPGARHAYSVEWLRPEPLGPDRVRLVCSQRQVGAGVHAFEPPLPLLELPLEPGRSWSWEGRVGGVRARTTTTTTERDHPGHGPVVEVLQRLVVLAPTGERHAERVLVFARPGGLVEERWRNPLGDREHHAARR